MAFVAVTVSVDELPALTEAGLALMLTVGADEPPELALVVEPHPVNTRRSASINTAADGKEIRLRDRWERSDIMVFPFKFWVNEQCSLDGHQHDTKQKNDQKARSLLNRGGKKLLQCAWLDAPGFS